MLQNRARIYAFPERQGVGNLLTVRDKVELHAAGERITASGLRCIIGRDRHGICHDFIQLHPLSELSVAWTLVRSGPVVRVWRGTHGPDLGAFPTLREAVEAALEAGTPGTAAGQG